MTTLLRRASVGSSDLSVFVCVVHASRKKNLSRLRMHGNDPSVYKTVLREYWLEISP